MAGLDPAIHVAPPHLVDMDARNKSGHDDVGEGAGARFMIPRDVRLAYAPLGAARSRALRA